jgi:uncharacterized repeat protein (TIGR03803 family)
MSGAPGVYCSLSGLFSRSTASGHDISLNASRLEEMSMSVSRQARSSFLRGKFSKALAALMFIWLLLGVQRAPAQTFSVLYNFTGGPDGGRPWAGVTVDGAGNLYGIATEGGNPHCSLGGDIGCGTVFKLTHKSGGWTFGLLYSFAGGADGWWPYAPVTHRPDGTLYGTTYFGGGTGCAGYGCGTVFQLRPPPTVCRSVMCPWTETEIYKFTGARTAARLLPA